MKREALREAYQFNTGKASDIARQLAFAGIAVVWIFRAGDGEESALPAELLSVLFWFGVGLALDLLQYVVCGAIWGLYNRYKEQARLHRGQDESFDAPVAINAPGLIFYWLKIPAIVFGHLQLILFLQERWRILG